MKHYILLSNDDGVHSLFLQGLAQVLHETFDIAVVAPAQDQSGMGRAYTCNRHVHSEYHKEFPYDVWSVDGTPSDCVHIALTHLLRRKPDAVISGINVGCNLSLPILFSSGTVGAAIEASLWHLPSLALSMDVSNADYDTLKQNHRLSHVDQSLKNAATHTVSLIQNGLFGNHQEAHIIHNINFPAPTLPDTPVEHTRLSKIPMAPFFQKNIVDDSYTFGFDYPENNFCGEGEEDTDIACCMYRRHISHNIIDLNRLLAFN